MRDHILYVGTYSGGGSQGIYAYRFSPESGSLVPLGLVAEAVNPSFIILDSERSVLYSVIETDSFCDVPSGAIQGYRIDPDTGKLSLLSQVSSNGGGPCFLSFDQGIRCIFVANFHGGSIAAFPLSTEGSILEPTAKIAYNGAGSRPGRQERPHPHDVELSPDGELLIVADLGLDRLLAYEYDSTNRAISSEAVWSVKVHDGAGPRHFVFSSKGSHLYIVNEIDSTVSVFQVGRRDRSLRHLQTISSLPTVYAGPNDAADIRLSSDNRFLYVSNRGADCIQVFAIDAASGLLLPLAAYSSGGKTPLSFQFSPDEMFIVVANQGSDVITVFRRDPGSGHLTVTGINEIVLSPASLAFFRAELAIPRDWA